MFCIGSLLVLYLTYHLDILTPAHTCTQFPHFAIIPVYTKRQRERE